MGGPGRRPLAAGPTAPGSVTGTRLSATGPCVERNAGERGTEAGVRDWSSGRSRGAMTVDRTIADVERATEGDESMRSSTCCRSACDVAATLQTTSADPVIA